MKLKRFKNSEPGVIVPKYIYKYCRSDVYEEFWLNNSMRIGALVQYREDFEKGFQYGDADEGLQTIIWPGNIDTSNLSQTQSEVIKWQFKTKGNWTAALSIQNNIDAYILSLSSDYSLNDHKIWHGRVGCEYDCCIKFSLDKLMDKFEVFLPESHWRTILAKPVEYGSKIKPLSYETEFSRDSIFFSNVFTKHQKFEWEKEVRIFFQRKKSRIGTAVEPINVTIPALKHAIEDVYYIEK